MAPYTIKSGDTLSQIVQKKYGLKSWKEIEKACWEVAKDNGIKNIDLIIKGNSLELRDSLFSNQPAPSAAVNNSSVSIFPVQPAATPPVQAVVPEVLAAVTPEPPKAEVPAELPEPVVQPELEPEPTPAATVAEEPVSEPTTGQKFDDWNMNNAMQAKQAWDDAMNAAGAFSKQHPEDENEELRNNYEAQASGEALVKISELPDFTFVDENYETEKKEKGNKTAYVDRLMTLSKSYLDISDTDKSGDLSKDEFREKEIADAKKLYTEEELSQVNLETPANVAFSTLDLNEDGKISAEEKAAAFAYLDQDAKTGKLDGTITNKDFSDFSLQIAKESRSSEIKGRIQSAYDFLFGKK